MTSSVQYMNCKGSAGFGINMAINTRLQYALRTDS